MQLKSIAEFALERRWGYMRAWRAALRGDFGPVVRLGRRLYVAVPPQEGSATTSDDGGRT
jgi:hypothetical protein